MRGCLRTLAINAGLQEQGRKVTNLLHSLLTSGLWLPSSRRSARGHWHRSRFSEGSYSRDPREQHKPGHRTRQHAREPAAGSSHDLPVIQGSSGQCRLIGGGLSDGGGNLHNVVNTKRTGASLDLDVYVADDHVDTGCPARDVSHQNQRRGSVDPCDIA